MGCVLGLVRQIDALYEIAVTAGLSADDAAVWLEDLAVEPPPRSALRHLRSAVRLSLKLAAFWSDPPPGVPDATDWRTKVDIALGAKAWRPGLDLTMSELKQSPSLELFDEVGLRFRLVHNQPWLDHIAYDEWLGTHHR